jgi:hypothetical protein
MAKKPIDIDTLIDIFRELSMKKDEFIEQEDGGGGESSGGGAGYPSVTKWETGVTRGPANPIGNTKWKDNYKITRGKANTLL